LAELECRSALASEARQNLPVLVRKRGFDCDNDQKFRLVKLERESGTKLRMAWTKQFRLGVAISGIDFQRVMIHNP